MKYQSAVSCPQGTVTMRVLLWNINNRPLAVIVTVIQHARAHPQPTVLLKPIEDKISLSKDLSCMSNTWSMMESLESSTKRSSTCAVYALFPSIWRDETAPPSCFKTVFSQVWSLWWLLLRSVPSPYAWWSMHSSSLKSWLAILLWCNKLKLESKLMIVDPMRLMPQMS